MVEALLDAPDAFEVAPGGPRASMPAKAGLNRFAKPPPREGLLYKRLGPLVSLCKVGIAAGASFSGLTADTSAGEDLAFGVDKLIKPTDSRSELVGRALERLSSTGLPADSDGTLGVAESRREIVPVRFISILLASPSGTGALVLLGAVRTIPRPSCWAFWKSSFFFRMASLNSSTLSVFLGPPVS